MNRCKVCGGHPVEPQTGLCGPCLTGDASTLGQEITLAEAKDRAAPRSVQCPACNAAIGEPCLGAIGEPCQGVTGRYHPSRHRAAEALAHARALGLAPLSEFQATCSASDPYSVADDGIHLTCLRCRGELLYQQCDPTLQQLVNAARSHSCTPRGQTP